MNTSSILSQSSTKQRIPKKKTTKSKGKEEESGAPWFKSTAISSNNA